MVMLTMAVIDGMGRYGTRELTVSGSSGGGKKLLYTRSTQLAGLVYLHTCILAKKEQKEEKENQPPHTQHKQTNTHIYTPKKSRTLDAQP